MTNNTTYFYIFLCKVSFCRKQMVILPLWDSDSFIYPQKRSDYNPDLPTFLLKYPVHKVFIKYLHMH